MLEHVSFDEQLQYWLEGWQWVEVLDRPVECWLRQVLDALVTRGVTLDRGSAGAAFPDLPAPASAAVNLDELFALARFTDQMWPVKAAEAPTGSPTRALRDLGAPQDDVLHRFPVGSRVQIRLEIEHDTNLLLLDRGPSGTLYCLCPSAFAPWPRLGVGRDVLPQPGARYRSFLVTGQPGREHLLALLSEAPLPFDWMSRDPRFPARPLDSADVEALIRILRALPPESWVALSTYFETVTT